jgi:hypothetical protein
MYKTASRKSHDIQRAEIVLYDWAQGNISTRAAKTAIKRHYGIDIDFRQADIGAEIVGVYSDGTSVTLEI